jgi:aminopeptidase N
MNRNSLLYWKSSLRAPAILFLLSLAICLPARADEPYGRTRSYDLQNSRISLRFDTAKKSVSGEVTHSLAALRAGVTSLEFDSVELTIQSVTVGGKAAKFEMKPDKLVVNLDKPSAAGEKYVVAIRYEGHPSRGLYFIVPDKDYPTRPTQVWTQGEAEDTRYYIPIYDYPDDQTTTDMILTVPASWVTVANGRLIGVKDAAGGMKTWTWSQSQPHSTYLISIVAGEYDELKTTWRGKPLMFYAPKGRGERNAPTNNHVKEILDFFSDSLGVVYPWDKYSISYVDDFVAGGMENTSATTNTSTALVAPSLAGESLLNADSLNAHETAHQWFGDLVTCKDWGHVWLNEGFATYFDALFEEKQYGTDELSYSLWQDRNGWMRQQRLFTAPIVTHNFSTMTDYSGNIYTKGGLVLHMLRRQLGDADFYKGLKHYLEVNRNHNVVTADLVKAIEEATGKSVEEFFNQWVYGAGAPRFEVGYTYDAAAKQVKMDVKQTQKVEGAVGLFHVPIEVEITTASGRKSSSIDVSKVSETFTFPADSQPLMVLFDRGGTILKSVSVKKSPEEWIYQLKHAATVSDRADAAAALGDVKGNDAVIASLGEASLGDKHWGVRVTSIRSLSQIGGSAAQAQIKAAAANEQPWVRAVAVQLMGGFKDDASIGDALAKTFCEDKALRVRNAALNALAQLKSANAYEVMTQAVAVDSVDDAIRATALRGLGQSGNDNAVPLLLEWAALGKPINVRRAAIASLGRLDKKNKDLTNQLIAYLKESNRAFGFQFGVVTALVDRGDKDALPAIDAWEKTAQLPIGGSFVQNVIARLRGPAPGAQQAAGQPGAQAPAASPAATDASMQLNQQILQQLDALRKDNAEIRDRLKKIEEKVGEKKP